LALNSTGTERLRDIKEHIMKGHSTRKHLRATLLVSAAIIWAFAALSADLRGQATSPAPAKAAPLDPRIAAYDKGPNKIDVAKYPKDMQDAYKVFSVKCVRCHTLARPINCDFALEDEWERYVKRMMNKAGTWISADQGKQIYEFLVYDSKTRKKDMYDKKLKEGKGGIAPLAH
jgi:hypothetical protein